MGAAGAIAGGYAMSFLVYEETKSTLSAALLLALQVIPQFLLPILIAPTMDRMQRKPFLVGGDLISGVLYGLAGLYLHHFPFSYGGYLAFSLLLACIGAMDSLAYHSIFPGVIPKGFEEKGYTVAGMLYPVMNVVVMPIAAVLLRFVGIANMLMIQGMCSILAGILESSIKVKEIAFCKENRFGFSLWFSDFLDGFRFLKGERGLLSVFSYMAVTNGMSVGFSPILVAFFSSAPGFTPVMYSFFSAAEFIGRSLGGAFHYHVKIPKGKKFCFTLTVYHIYEFMDMVLLWIPYPWMLLNRGVCGFLGINSATERSVAVQRYIPEAYRARVNAFESAMVSIAGSILSLTVGMLGELLSYRLTMTVSAVFCIVVCWITIWKNQADVRKIYET